MVNAPEPGTAVLPMVRFAERSCPASVYFATLVPSTSVSPRKRSVLAASVEVVTLAEMAGAGMAAPTVTWLGRSTVTSAVQVPCCTTWPKTFASQRYCSGAVVAAVA